MPDTEVLIDQAAALYAHDKITLDELEEAVDAALAGDRDGYYQATRLDSYAWLAPVPLPPPSGLNVRTLR